MTESADAPVIIRRAIQHPGTPDPDAPPVSAETIAAMNTLVESMPAEGTYAIPNTEIVLTLRRQPHAVDPGQGVFLIVNYLATTNEDPPRSFDISVPVPAEFAPEMGADALFEIVCKTSPRDAEYAGILAKSDGSAS